MSEFPDHFDTPEDAYFGFFRADSAQNAVGWAAVMNYPHVRVAARAAGRLYYCDTAEEYAAGADWTARKATGWVESRGRDPIRLHESARKVHLAGGWTRYNAAGEPILSNLVTYILTRPGDSWGIQARFSADSFEGAGDGAAAVAVVRRFCEALANDDFGECAGLCRYPFVRVGVGEVQRASDGAALRQMLGAAPVGEVVRVESAQSGARGANVALTSVARNGRSEHALMVVGEHEGAWRIAGLSTLPAE